MKFSVIITTFNRASKVRNAIESVLSQDGVDLEVIVVDDGSTDETRSVLEQYTDPRVVTLFRQNGGLSAARNSGAAAASGDWITFLDDDDAALPGWLAGFRDLIDDHVGAVCCAAEYRKPDGGFVARVWPTSMGALYHHVSGMILAGTFAVRADVLRAIGGYDEEVICSHQTELWLRLIPAIRARNLAIGTTQAALVKLEWRETKDRPLKDPARLYEGVSDLLNKHRESFARDPDARALYKGVLGVSAARLGNWPNARAALLASVRANPRRLRAWLRLATAMCPPIARRVWPTASRDIRVPQVAP